MANDAQVLDPIDALTLGAEEGDLVSRMDTTAIAAITRSEVESQITAAHKYPRSIARFLKDARTLATITQDVAESCIYSIPRDGKLIAGPSVRLAELCASAYGNLHVAARVLDPEARDIGAQGVAWDLERNLRVTVETRRRIVGRNGKRYNDDLIILTGNAAASIALRNAIFRVIPRSYVQLIYDAARKVSVGDAKTLDARRTEIADRLQKIGVPFERVLAKLGKTGIEDIGLEDLEVLIGLGSAIKNGEAQIDDLFPPAAPAPAAPADDGKRISLKGNKNDAPAAAKDEQGSLESQLQASVDRGKAK
jgi:hypothetical protein